MKIPPKVKAWLVDTAENVGLAAVLPFLATVVSDQGGFLHVATWKAGAVAGIGAGLAVLYSSLATLKKNSLSPASMMPAQQPGQAESDAPPAVEHLPTKGTEAKRQATVNARKHTAARKRTDGGYVSLIVVILVVLLLLVVIGALR